jgi:hypothetical protein
MSSRFLQSSDCYAADLEAGRRKIDVTGWLILLLGSDQAGRSRQTTKVPYGGIHSPPKKYSRIQYGARENRGRDERICGKGTAHPKNPQPCSRCTIAILGPHHDRRASLLGPSSMAEKAQILESALFTEATAPEPENAPRPPSPAQRHW